ncbi:prepilin-type N-terminal cleavage/methylation domain-containing protein [Cyanobium sp. FGCU-6]|nr:prepilin-type N-terminal cleavage/methylation domain-containing protein [Cyanobium sp. FGCU6]
MRGPSGYSLTELMVVVAILGLIGVTSITGALEQWRTEQSSAVANELSGWLGSVHRAALRGKRCEITIAPDTSPDPLTGNAVAATAREVDDTDPIDNGCLAHSPLVIHAVSSGTSFTLTPRNTTFSFTPRGTVAEASLNPLEFRIAITTGGAIHCVRLMGLLGLVKIGHVAAGSCHYRS